DNTQPAPFISWSMTFIDLFAGPGFGTTSGFNNVVLNSCDVNTCTLSTDDELIFPPSCFPQNGGVCQGDAITFTTPNTHPFLQTFSASGVQFDTQSGNGPGFSVQGKLSIPEPRPGILVLIGLLVLAGARWWTHRQER